MVYRGGSASISSQKKTCNLLLFFCFDKLLVFEAFVKTPEALASYESQKIPWSHIMAYIGPDNHPNLKQLYQKLHQRGVMCMISTAPTYDKLPSATGRTTAYQAIIRDGASLIEADRSIEAAATIVPLRPANSAKKKFFGKKPV